MTPTATGQLNASPAPRIARKLQLQRPFHEPRGKPRRGPDEQRHRIKPSEIPAIGGKSGDNQENRVRVAEYRFEVP